ncbi:MAG: hypothetical protein AB1758_24615, partial [Candidatus Eremiobacterota bacterium]
MARLQEKRLEEPVQAFGVGAGVTERPCLVLHTGLETMGSLPFARTLSLDRLIAFWEGEARTAVGALRDLAGSILQGLEAAPELRGGIADVAVLEPHRGLVDAMMTAVFPQALRNLAFSAAVYPGEMRVFYATPRYRREALHPDGTLKGEYFSEDGVDLSDLMTIFAGLGILRRVYGIDLPFEKSILFKVSGDLNRYHQIRAHLDFAEIRVRGAVPELPPEAVELLRSNITDMALWRRVLPEGLFEFYGFIVHDVIDVTEEVV